MRRRLILPIVVATALLAPRAAPAQAIGGGISVFENCGVGDAAFYLALEADPKVEGRRLLRGGVQINCQDVRLFADEVAIDDKLVIATGHVVFSQQSFYVSAARAELDRHSRLGVFFDASGVAQLTKGPVQPNAFGTMEPQVMFYGARIEKTGDRTYRLSNGGFSTCEQPTPRWEIVGTKATVTLDERVILRNAVLKVKNVPILYLPFLYYPLGEDDRSTGFLIPSYSNSSVQGTGISNAFFLVLGRSMDAMFKHTWFSKGGQVMSAGYRFASAPGSDGATEITVIAEPDEIGEGGLVTRAGERSFRFTGRLSQGLPRGFRLVGNANFFTDLLNEQLYQQNLYRATQRERYFNASLSGNLGRYTRLTITADQRDYFFGVDNASRRGTLPRVSLAFNRNARKVYFGLDGETAYLVKHDELSDPLTDRSLLRFDAAPTIRAPLSSLAWLKASTTASWRLTHWLESRDPITEQQVPVRLTRNLLELTARVVGPVLSRVWSPENGYARRVKHLIEPEFNFRWFSPFDRIDEVVQHDHVDGQVGGTTSLTYGLTNRIMVRRTRPTGPGEVRQILVVSLAQTYNSNQLATAYDPLYQSQLAGSFTPLRFTVNATPADGVAANFQTEIDPEFRRPRHYTLSGTIDRQRAQFTGGWTKRQVIAGLPGFDENSATHFLNAAVGVRPLNGRVQSRYELNFDIKNRALLQQRVFFSYSAQCCGVNVDYQTFSFASFPGLPDRTDRRFGISFTLAGIGSFSNPLGSFGNNSGR
jgi:lipopolysaccharide assembly outer membrane protein LptD (OstA)